MAYDIIKKGIGCGYPLCPYFDEAAPTLVCPCPIQGAACEGLNFSPLLCEKEKVKRDFCVSCGAGFPPRKGEGHCLDWMKCQKEQNSVS